MTASNPEPESPPPTTPGSRRARVSLPKLLALAAVVLPLSWILVAWSLIVVTNNLDVAYALGVSDNVVMAVVVAGAGLAAGLIVALVARLRDWQLGIPPAAGLIVGVGIYLGFVAFETEEIVELGGLSFITIAAGQLIAIVAASRISALSLAGVIPAVIALGIVAASYVQAIPPAPAEVLIVLDVYHVEESTGECSGAGELAGVEEGSEVFLLELPEFSGRSTEVGSVILPSGHIRGGGCMFELGNPLGLTAAGYGNIDFFPESDPDAPYSISLEGDRVTVQLGRAEE